MTTKPVILITGGNQGLGHEALKVLARTKRYHLVVAARSQQKADDAIKTISSETASDSADFTPVVINLENDDSIFAAAKIVKEKFGHLDVLVNNAGINRSPNENATLRENYQAVFETNVFGVAVMNDTFLPLIRASNHPRRRIVTVTSGLGMFGVALTETSPYNIWKYQIPVYRSSKSAVNMLSAVDTIILQDENIPTVLVEPGYCRTAFGGYSGHKDAELGGKVIARAAVEGENKDLFLKIIDDEGKHAEFGW
jgi:NAD(P)-dependent dehydrogenase (short-subunit alcohol dehydrogenase family)